MYKQNVASTFKGVIRALREFSSLLVEHDIQIWVRRAGPNYQEGLKNIKAAGQELKLNIHVYGPECGLSAHACDLIMLIVCRPRLWYRAHGASGQEPQWRPGVLWLNVAGLGVFCSFI